MEVFKINKKKYIRNREHFAELIPKYEKEGEVAQKFAKIMSSETEDAVIGHIQRDTAKILGIKPKTEIHI